MTCWDLTSTTGALPTITPTGHAASESASCNLTLNPARLKYSFTLADPNSSNGTRVSGLTATLTDNNNNSITWSEAQGNLTVGLSEVGQDFLYNGANGANSNYGDFGVLTSSDQNLNGDTSAALGYIYNAGCNSEPAYVNAIQGGSVQACGPVPAGCPNSDNFPGNDGTGGDRAQYTARTASPGLSPSGSPYTLTVQGTLKDSVLGLASLAIGVCASVTVDAGQCLKPQTSTTCPQ